MKKFISILLALVMMLSFTGFSTIYAISEDSVATIAGENVTGTVGQMVSIPLTLKNCQALGAIGNGSICGIEVDFKYDTSVLKFLGARSLLPTTYLNPETNLQESTGWQADGQSYNESEFNGKILIDDSKKVGFDATGDVPFGVLVFSISPDVNVQVNNPIQTDIEFKAIDICDSDATKLICVNDSEEPNVVCNSASVTVSAADVPDSNLAVISADDTIGYAGERVEIPLTLYHADALSELGNGRISGIEVNLSYNAEDLNLVGGVSLVASSYYDPVDDDYVLKNWDLDCNAISTGLIKTMVSDTKLIGVATEGDIPFANVYFTIPENLEVGTKIEIVVTAVDICDSNSQKLISGTTAEGFTITVGDLGNKAVNDVVSAINKIGTITSTEKAGLVQSAREAYDALEPSQQEQVTNYNVLLTAETILANYQAAEQIDKLIDAASKVRLLSERATVQTARDAYNKLLGAVKELVTKLDLLTAAEAEMQRLSAIPKGDVDGGDGKATVADVLAMRKRIIAGSATPEQMAAGDMNEDGMFTVSDVIQLRKLIMRG